MNSLKQFFKEEDGAITIVEILIILAIVVAIALIFRNQITAWVQTMMGNVFGDTGQWTDTPTPTPTPKI